MFSKAAVLCNATFPNTTVTTAQLEAAWRARGASRMFVKALMDAVATSDQLVEACDMLARRMAGVSASVARSGNPNSLGEVQRMGPDVDRLCAVRAAQLEMAGQLAELVLPLA